LRSEFSQEEWRLAGNLADHPYRLLVTITPDGGGESYAEVAHEAIFRRWDRLGGWIAAERGFLAWRTGLEAARRAWQATPDASKNDALLMGLALANAQSWLAKRAEDIPARDRDFIARSGKAAQRRRLRQQALVGVLAIVAAAGLAGWVEHDDLQELWRWVTVTRPYMQAQVSPFVLTGEAERALKPKQSFRECKTEDGQDYCPEMVVVPARSFMMGSPETEKDRLAIEGPQHKVMIAQPFAVAKFELTFAQWDTCVDYGDCPRVSDSGWGRDRQPVINVSWDDAQRYVEWLKSVTGKPYRLLSEAEYEYAARAGAQTAYPWGDEIGKGNAKCNGCGSQWDGKQPAPVGSFAPNRFGLYDMVGNVFEWVEDCVHGYDNGAPEDGTARLEEGDCPGRVVRGGAWFNPPQDLRSANRLGLTPDGRGYLLGFRVGRTLTP
jgi:formylglycine-generating enzyme required for sulfatase activity